MDLIHTNGKHGSKYNQVFISFFSTTLYYQEIYIIYTTNFAIEKRKEKLD